MTKKLIREAFGFPAFILLLILLAEVAENFSLPFSAALLPLIIGGGAVCLDTLREVWQSRRITTGILVVLALIGTVFTGEYMEGAEVSFMMLLGEALEEFSMKKMRGSGAFSEENNVQRMTDRFANYFLPIIIIVCLLVFAATRDVSRVMSILVMACPCSLVLSSPAAILACAENASRRGILLPDGGTIERLGNARDVRPDGRGGFFTDNGISIGSSKDCDVILQKASASNRAEKTDHDALSWLLGLTRKTRIVILENIFLFAFLFNLTGITLSGLGILTIVPGAVLHNTATICVLLNSARLFRWKPGRASTAS